MISLLIQNILMINFLHFSFQTLLITKTNYNFMLGAIKYYRSCESNYKNERRE